MKVSLDKINSRIELLKDMGAPRSIMIDIRARLDRVQQGKESQRSFQSYLNNEIIRLMQV